MSIYGDKVKEIRTSLKLSQRALAELIDTTRDIIAAYEAGRARVTAEAWEKINALRPNAK